MIRHANMLVALLVALLALALLWTFPQALALSSGARMAELTLDSLPHLGIGNPVTAVLLGYRGFDTLIELTVLLTALLGIWSLGRATPPFQSPELVLTGLAAWILPLLVLVAGYLLWTGAEQPGGAFQAGALLGAAGVVLRLTGEPRAGLPSERVQRLLAIAGVAAFTLVALATMFAGLGFLTYPSGPAKWLILLIETASTVAIGATLAGAYVGGRPEPLKSIHGQDAPASPAVRTGSADGSSP